MPVYLIRAGETDMVKIGWADDPEARRADLQTGHYEELRILRLIEGSPATERWLHRYFRTEHVRREWFQFRPTMMDIEPPHLAAPEIGAIAEIIDRLGGTPVLARAIGLPPSRVQKWRDRNSIPAKYHLQVLSVAGERLTAAELINAHSPTRATSIEEAA